MKLKDNLGFLLSTIFPRHCVFCGQISDWYLCDNCLKTISVYKQNRCAICSKPIVSTESRVICPICLSKTRFFEKGFSLFNYEDSSVKKLIELIKFHNTPQLSSILNFFKNEILNSNMFSNIEYLVPVPMHKKDIKKRGYNQAVIIAKYLSKITDIPVYYSCLKKIKITKQQVGLNYEGRIKNMSGAFSVNKRCIKKVKNILLVDDVFTTGSTINECAKILHKNGISSRFLTLATTPFNS